MPGPNLRDKNRVAQKPKNARATIKRLVRYMAAYKFLWVAVFVFVLVSALARVAGSYIIRPAVNNYIIPLMKSEHPDFTQFAFMLLKMFAFYVCGAFASWANARILLHISTKSLYKIRMDLFAHLEKLPLKFHDAHPHGEIMSRFTNDVDALRDMLSQTVSQFMSSAVTIVAVYSMMIFLSPILAILVTLCMAGMFVLSTRIGKISAAAFRENQKNLGEVNGYIEEIIEGQKVVKVFNYEMEAVAHFAELNEKLRSAGTKANAFAGILMPMMGNLSHVQYAAVAIAGAYLVIQGHMDLGTIAAFLQYTRTFSYPVTQMSQEFNGVLNALAGAERIFSIIDEEAEIDEGSATLVNAYHVAYSGDTSADATSYASGQDAPIEQNIHSKLVQSFGFTGEWAWKIPPGDNLKEVRGEVVFDNVTFGYKEEKMILHDIAIHAKPGKKIALVGSTGSGKTTVTNLLTRFYDVKAGNGEILYDGLPLNSISKSALRRSLGMVLQDTHLFTGTIRDNIRYGNLEASDVQIENAAKLANADSFIRKLSQGYDTVITGDGGNLSQGQRQLLAIARAAVADPPVLILDEATSSIDTRTEKLIQQGMDSLMAGRTVFVIAHRLSTVRNADEIVVLEHGTIIERGNHEELLAQKGRYYRLCRGTPST